MRPCFSERGPVPNEKLVRVFKGCFRPKVTMLSPAPARILAVFVYAKMRGRVAELAEAPDSKSRWPRRVSGGVCTRPFWRTYSPALKTALKASHCIELHPAPSPCNRLILLVSRLFRRVQIPLRGLRPNP